jgi:hypothetical protein
MACFLHLFDCKRIANFLLVSTTQMRKLQLAWNQKSSKNQSIKKWNFRLNRSVTEGCTLTRTLSRQILVPSLSFTK